MNTPKQTLDKLIDSLEERVKELNCLYEVEELLHNSEIGLDEIFQKVVKSIPAAWQYPEICNAKIVYNEKEFITDHYKDSPWALNADITLQDRTVGWIRVCYSEEKPERDVGPFLIEERRLLNSIALRLSHYVLYQKLKQVFHKWETTKHDISAPESETSQWQVILELLRRTDSELYIRISRKMLNYLVWTGVEESEKILQQFGPFLSYGQADVLGESNIPLEKRSITSSFDVSQKIFDIAAQYLNNQQILTLLQKWMQEDKTAFLVREIANNNTSLTEIAEAIRRYYQLNPEGMELAPFMKMGVRASLIRRFFSEQLEFINIAKNYVMVRDFYEILHRTIFPQGSHGKLGGKSAGMFLAYKILKNFAEEDPVLKNIHTPKTWYITSDALIYFMQYNNLEEVLEQKYKPIEDVRKEYPHVVQLFKNSHFPPDIVQGLSMALDDFGTTPLVVRSSSLLEDRLGSAFSGKYKSLFIANQGTKRERLAAVMDAIAEVYASTIGPDPIEYRAERGLLDFHEEMGVMIQEVVGQKIGDFFLPAFAGVAFSNNEFRWSPRIKRDDGLIRLVPGLGTRAVDRLSDDYPVLIAPGQPGLRTNISFDDIVHYSPQKVDVIDLKTNCFETIDIKALLKCCGNDFPLIEKLVSIVEYDNLKKPSGMMTDFTEDHFVITFEGLINDTSFIKQMHTILRTLQNALGTPVDIEFASNGKDFYLLQCRPQSYTKLDAPSPIPKELPRDRTIFTAHRYVSNGTIPDIAYIVYVDPQHYSELRELSDLTAVGRAIGQLNQLLPKRQFILMGPGRWGSRGDIKLGVNVTYSDINNTAMLIEIARKKGNYVPDLSFGTHFFQDLVEASIRYLPLYPDDPGVVFNDEFLLRSPNALMQFLPGFSYLSDTIRLIEIPSVSDRMVMRILMNADQNKAVGILMPKTSPALAETDMTEHIDITAADHWSWRLDMAEKIAAQLNAKRFGIKAIYLTGSTRTTTAQPGSDIDLLIDFVGNKTQKKELLNWLEGWSLCLDEMNFLRTGFKAGGLLDVDFISDEQLADEEYIISKYGRNKDGLKELPLADD